MMVIYIGTFDYYYIIWTKGIRKLEKEILGIFRDHMDYVEGCLQCFVIGI